MHLTIEVPSDALIVLIAPAGAGKTTFARQHFRHTEIVSSDLCRALVSDDEANQEATGPAFEVFDAILRGRLRLGRLSVADATNLEAIPRQRLRELAREFGRSAIAIVLDVPPDVAHAQNLARARSVPPHVLESHYDRFKAARDVLSAEGYSAIHEVQPGYGVEVLRVGPDHRANPGASPSGGPA
jgi:protein phosphatase